MIKKYKNLGDEIEEINELGYITSCEYDTQNRLVKTTDPQGNVYTNEYDSVGNIIKIINPKGNGITKEYDSLNRLTKIIDAIRYLTRKYKQTSSKKEKERLHKEAELT